jgi:hypothetical protein
MPVKTKQIISAKDFISQLAKDYPALKFQPGSQDHWSPKSQTITYDKAEALEKMCCGILHELAHAVLDHTSYNSDFELVKLESEAWSLAAKMGQKYGVEIDDEHIQNCLDTYRDWLHRRSACPKCGTHVLQKDVKHYQCYNCQASWQVSAGRFVRPYRRSVA